MIRIGRVTGLATVQDLGRPGFMHAGVPAGGAMSRELLTRANAAARNAAGAAAIEAFGDVEVFAEETTESLATSAGETRMLAAGESVVFRRPSSQRVHYVAVRGGLDVPLVLGGRGTLLVANLGGHEGRALRRGDALPVGAAPLTPDAPAHDDTRREEPRVRIRVSLGPDLDAFPRETLDVLTAGLFTISPASDRTGTRLLGPPLLARPGPTRPSAPMVPGAIEITPDGGAIVLGPDHPTTGGYPVLACVRARDLGKLMALPLGAELRFDCA